MSISTPAIAPGEGGSKGKRKRVRKRSTKKRTNSAAETAAAAATSDAESSSSSSSSSDDEEEKREGESSSRPSGAASRTEEGSSSNKGSTVNTRADLPGERKTPEEGEKAKRKRKRTRRKGEKKDEQEGEKAEEGEGSGDNGKAIVASGDSIVAKAKPQVKEFQSYLKSLDPSTSSSSSLSNEKTIKALEYALQYHLDRANWKFSKAKQEFLIRHMLTPPLAATRAEVGEVEESKEGTNEEEEVERKADQYWPDEWNRCVARYLITIQGQAKQRIFDLLQREAQQEIPEGAAPAKEEEVSDQAIPVSGARSVSFGDLAMDQEASFSSAQQSHQSASAITPEERQRRLFAKQRASTLLREMED